MTTEEAARYVGLAPATLAGKRVYGGGPPWAKLGRSVRYRVTDLDEWLAAQIVDGARKVPA